MLQRYALECKMSSTNCPIIPREFSAQLTYPLLTQPHGLSLGRDPALHTHSAMEDEEEEEVSYSELLKAGLLFINSGGGEWSVLKPTGSRIGKGQAKLIDRIKDIRENWVLDRDSLRFWARNRLLDNSRIGLADLRYGGLFGQNRPLSKSQKKKFSVCLSTEQIGI
jgi:hypothetical protein